MRTQSVWDEVAPSRQRALVLGALQPITTETEFLEEAGIQFVVRRVSSLVQKARVPQGATATHTNPFLPCDPDLFVAEISPTHVALLNKYNVIDHHILVVTRVFEEQRGTLTVADFDAAARCLDGSECLVFYNSGPIAGASQPHRHLQAVPLPLFPKLPAIPLEPLFGALPFRHTLQRFGVAPGLGASAAAMHEVYLRTLGALGLVGAPYPAPYNLLLTRRWMLVVPRTVEYFEGISINALAFAGSLFVKDAGELARLRSAGPLAALRTVVGG